MTDYLSNNPAGRLYQILSEVRRQPNSSGTMQKVWANIFNLDEKDTREILLVYTALLDLLKDAREAVEQMPDIDFSLYMAPFEQLERAFTVSSFTTNLQTFKNYLDDRTMTALQFCAHSLSKITVEVEIPQELLEKLCHDVEELTSEILSSDLQYELRVFLLERLEEIRRAIIYYRINGAKELKRALESTLGASYLLSQSSQSVDFKNEEQRQKWRRISSWFTTLVIEITKAVAPEVAKALMNSKQPILPP